MDTPLKNNLTLADVARASRRAASAVTPTAGHVETTLDTARLEAYATSSSNIVLHRWSRF
jgi:hypothetical protein